MNTIFLAVIAACLLIMVVFLIPVLIELRKTIACFRKTMDEDLKPTLDELQAALKGLRTIADEVEGITSDVRVFSKSIGEVGHMVGSLNGIVEDIGSSMTLRAFSLKAGIGAAMEYLARNLIRKGDER